MQADFLCELLDNLSSVHKAVETCGYCAEEKFLRVLERVDYIMMDVKLADAVLHRKWCGVDNEVILKNVENVKKSGKPHLFRVPLIPDITDTADNLRAIAEIVGDSPAELLPYNPFAGAKYEGVGREFTLTAKENRAVDLSVFANAKIRQK